VADDARYLGAGARLASLPSAKLVDSAFRAELRSARFLYEGLSYADLAHVLMLAEQQIIPAEPAGALLSALVDLHQAGLSQLAVDPKWGDLYNNRDAELQPFVLGPVPDGERGPHRALGVVAVGDRRAEDAHDGIADELLDAPAVALELSPNAFVVGNEERPHVLRVELLGAGGEPDEIDEQHRDDSPFLPGRGGSGEGCAAGVAELRPVRVLLSAAWAGEHER